MRLRLAYHPLSGGPRKALGVRVRDWECGTDAPQVALPTVVEPRRGMFRGPGGSLGYDVPVDERCYTKRPGWEPCTGGCNRYGPPGPKCPTCSDVANGALADGSGAVHGKRKLGNAMKPEPAVGPRLRNDSKKAADPRQEPLL